MTTELREQKTKVSNILGVFHTLSCLGGPHPCSRNHKTGLIVSLLVGAACCPSAMFGQGHYWASPFVVYVAANGSDDLLWTDETPGGLWTTGAPITGQFSALPPALATFGGEIFLAYVANNGTHDLMVTNGTGGYWNTSTPVTGQSSSMSPALTFFGDELVLAYVANNDSHDLLVTSSTDGVNWTKSTKVGVSSAVAPALTTFGNQLVLAYVANDGTDNLLVAVSTNGVNWTPEFTGQSTSLSPALTVFNGELVLAYVADDGTHDLWVATSPNPYGFTWNKKTPVTGQKSPVAPALSVIPNPTYSQSPFTTFNLMMIYVADNGSNDLFVTTSANGTEWTTTTAPITGQYSRVTPALCIVENYNSQ